MLRRGQAMVETVLAVLIVTSVFLCLFRLSRLLQGKILMEHAAMRVARARTVGMNDFMCRKAARLAMLPAAGRRLWPEPGEDFDEEAERARFGNYLLAKDGGIAHRILDYEGWHRLSVEPSDGTRATVILDTRQKTDPDSPLLDCVLEGHAGVEENATLYLNGF